MVKRIFLRDSGRAKCCVLQDKIRQNVSRKMDGEACPADGGGTRSFRVGATIFPVILWRVLQPQGLCQRHWKLFSSNGISHWPMPWRHPMEGHIPDHLCSLLWKARLFKRHGLMPPWLRNGISIWFAWQLCQVWALNILFYMRKEAQNHCFLCQQAPQDTEFWDPPLRATSGQWDLYFERAQCISSCGPFG